MKDRAIVVYYSHSGNTKHIAEIIADKAKCELCEINEVISYPKEYNAVVEQAKKEISQGIIPEIKSISEDISQYDVIFVGSPNWWSTIAPPIMAFLKNSDLANKRIIPFCTHGGGGIAGTARDVAKFCPHSKVLNGFGIYGRGGKNTDKEIEEWLMEVLK